MKYTIDVIPTEDDILFIANAARCAMPNDGGALKAYTTLEDIPQNILDVARFVAAALAGCPPNFVIRRNVK